MAINGNEAKEKLEWSPKGLVPAEAWKKAADECYHKKRYQDALVLYQAALKQDLENTTYLNDLGLSFLRLKRYEEAIKQFNSILERYKAIERKPGEEIDKHYLPMVPVLLNKASACNLFGQYETAKNCCREILQMNPSHKLALQLKADAYFCCNELSKAITHYSKALIVKPIDTSDPNWLKATYSKGYALYLLGKYPEAILCFEAAITQDPTHLEALYYKGLSQYAMKEFRSLLYRASFIWFWFISFFNRISYAIQNFQ